MSFVQSIKDNIASVRHALPSGVQLVCVSKFHPASMIQQAYDEGERDFAESRVQELLIKQQQLPQDIRWHFIGHLQTNKVRSIVPFVHLIQSVDSEHLLNTINTEAQRIGRCINVLLEAHVAREETKSGFTLAELEALLTQDLPSVYPYVHVCGVMGMATLTDDTTEIIRCFDALAQMHRQMAESMHVQSQSLTLSMGMSSDYTLAIEHGSTMVRVGTTIFGERNY